MKKIKIVQIGVNYYSHAVQIFKSIKKQSDIFELCGYVLPENERERYPDKMDMFEGLREYTLEEVLSNPEIDAVAVETDEIYLTKYALLAAKAGKHIHMEKPGGANLHEFEQLIETVKESKTVLHIGYMYRYNPFIKDAIERAKRGEFGEIVSVDAQMNCIHKPNVRKWLETLPGGMMFYLGCHLIDIILRIQGEPLNILPLSKETGVDGIFAKDFGMVILEYKNGMSFAKTVNTDHGGFHRRQLVITGSKASIEIKPLEWYNENDEIHTVKREYTSMSWHNDGEESVTEPFDRYDGMMAAFAKMARGECENPYTYDYELTLYKTLLKCCDIK